MKRESIDEQVTKILTLEKGWDSYGANPPDPEVVMKTALLAKGLEPHFSWPPSLVPLSSGDMQFEWHCDGWDVEVVVERHRYE